MATLISSPSSKLSTYKPISNPTSPKNTNPTFAKLHENTLKLPITLTATTLLLISPLPSLATDGLQLYYGTAASAANYGGYGGNSDKKTSAEYTYLVPSTWKERLVSKVEKGTNGTDSEFYNPKKKTEKEYLTYLSGFRALAPKEVVLNNLALSDVSLQDLIASAEDGVKSKEEKDEKGQIYYEYEIDGATAHGLIKVTCARNKLYAHFVNAPNAEWGKDEQMLRELHDSFKTVDYSS